MTTGSPTKTPDMTAVICGHGGHHSGERCILAPGHDEKHRNIADGTWFNYGPLERYEITWMSGHTETVVAHQVTYPHAGMALTSHLFGTGQDGGAPRIRMHAEINERWVLTLAAREEDIRTIRNVTGGERVPS